MDSPAQLKLPPEFGLPEIDGFQPLPEPDELFSAQIEALVEEAGLTAPCPADENCFDFEEFGSICVFDLTRPDMLKLGHWNMMNFVYPAASVVLYIIGECIRQAMAGEFSLEDAIPLKKHNIRQHSHLKEGQVLTVAELMRLMVSHFDATAANELIDLLDRRRVSTLLRAMECTGSDLTRKFLPRELEDEEFVAVPSTYTCANHLATFLYSVENGVIGAGFGRALIKGFLAMNTRDGDRFRRGIPDRASVYSTTGTWRNFSIEASIVEDGLIRYIMAAMMPHPAEEADPRLASFAGQVHRLIRENHEK